MPRSSSRSRSLSSGSITTKRACRSRNGVRSAAGCPCRSSRSRSSRSGRDAAVDGPVGHRELSPAGSVLAADRRRGIDAAGIPRRPRFVRLRRPAARLPGHRGDQRRASAPSPGARISPRAPSSAPGDELAAEQPVLLVRARQPQRCRSSPRRSRSGRSRAHRRPAARRCGRALRVSHGAAHQRRADAAVAAAGSTASGPSNSAGRPAPAVIVPQPDGADHAAVLDRDERQSVGGSAAFAQLAGGLAEADPTVGGVEQRSRAATSAFLADRDHGASIPRRGAASHSSNGR